MPVSALSSLERHGSTHRAGRGEGAVARVEGNGIHRVDSIAVTCGVAVALESKVLAVKRHIGGGP
jgi:hypothetical protein